jgi:hypothetical protein
MCRLTACCAVILGIVLLGEVPARAIAYGEAEVNLGTILLVRSGIKTRFSAPRADIAIEKGDVLLVQSASQAVLHAGKATFTLGENTVFQVEPWEAKTENGSLRFLFGKFRASVLGLGVGEHFAIKTSTATIGVKGTEFAGAATSQGDVVVLVTNSVVEITGLSGEPQSAAPGQVVVALNGKEAATPPALPPPEVRAALEAPRMESPRATAAAASNLPAEQTLVQSGIVTEAELTQSKLSQPDFRDVPEPEPEDRAPEIRYKLEDFPLPKLEVGPRIPLYLVP